MGIPMPYPTWHRDPQEHALEVQRANHDQALAIFGEYAMFSLMWNLEDHLKGLVERCSVCWKVNEKRAAAYGQSSQEDCPNCFGTTFEGGYKARIVRLSLWDHNEKDREESKRGEVQRQTATVQSTHDFRLRSDDYVFRADGSRWRVQQIQSNHLRHGFQMTSNSRTPVAFTYSQVIREDESMVAYQIPPAPEDSDIWDIINQPYPADFSEIEDIRGDVLHQEEAAEGSVGSPGESL